MCFNHSDNKHKLVKGKSFYGGGLREVEFVGTPESIKGKQKKNVPVGMYASKKDIIKY